MNNSINIKNTLLQIRMTTGKLTIKQLNILLLNVHFVSRGVCVGLGRDLVKGMLFGVNLSKEGIILSKAGWICRRRGKHHSYIMIIDKYTFCFYHQACM